MKSTPYKSYFSNNTAQATFKISEDEKKKQEIINRLSEKYSSDQFQIRKPYAEKVRLNEQDEEIQTAIEALRDGKFSNKSERMEFLKLILPLALSSDPQARKFIKAVGDLATDFFTETSQENETNNVITTEEGNFFYSQSESVKSKQPELIEVDGKTVKRYSFESDVKEEFQSKPYKGSLYENNYREKDIDKLFKEVEKDKDTKPVIIQEEVEVKEPEKEIIKEEKEKREVKVKKTLPKEKEEKNNLWNK